MTYLDALLYTGGFMWIMFGGIMALATLINASSGDHDAAGTTATLFWMFVVVSVVVSAAAGLVWWDQQ